MASKNGTLSSKTAKAIEIPALEMQQITIDVIGTAPLLVSRFSEKAKREILEKQQKKANKAKAARKPEDEFMSSLYLMSDGKTPGFPAGGFKGAMMRACKLVGMVMIDTRVLFRVIADDIGPHGELVEIQGQYEMHEGTVRLKNGSSDLRYRAIFKEWMASITVEYNASVLSAEQIANLVNWSGQCGIGEWRPEKSNTGIYGTYRIL